MDDHNNLDGADHDYEALARAAYPTDGRLEVWVGAFEEMIKAGAKLVLLWGMRDDDKAREKYAKVRAEAEAAGKAPGKAVWQARKGPQHTGWRQKVPTAQEVRDHLAVGGWIGIQIHSVGMVLVDVDAGGDAAADEAERKVGCRALYRQPTATPGRLHLAWRAEGVRVRKWKVPGGGGGEIVREGNQAVVWHPVEMLAAIRDARDAPVAPVERLGEKGGSKGLDLDFAPTTNEGVLAGAIKQAVETIEASEDGERNDTAAAQAWRAGVAAGNAEDVDPEEAREQVVQAAVDAAPDEEEKARETAGRQFDEGLAMAAAGLQFEVRGPRREAEAQAAADAIAEEEVTEEDVERLEAWRNGEPLPEPEMPDMSRGGEQHDVSRAVAVEQPDQPIAADADRARIARKGGMLGFDSHRLGASLAAFERAFPGWIVALDEKDRPLVWEWSNMGWKGIPWGLARARLAAYLEPRHYTLQKKDAVLDASGSELRPEQWKVIPRPTPGGSTGMQCNVARMMAGLVDFYTDTAWHDWNPLVAAHPDGTATDFLAGERRPQRRNEMAMRRTGVSPSKEWRGSWFEERLKENVPSASDRLLLQCLLGTCLMGINPDQTFIWFEGPPGSGKDGMALAVAMAIGGDYTHVLPLGRILSGRSSSSTGDSFSQVNSKAMLHEARLAVVADEPARDDVLNNGAYKSLSGGGASEGRKLQANVKAQHGSGFTCLAVCNHKPFVKERDGAVERRTYTIAFPVKREGDMQRDNRVNRKMLHEVNLADLLAWIVEGAVMVAQCGGLPPRTEQQLRRARFPELGDDGPHGGSSGGNYARDLHAKAESALVTEQLHAFWKQAVEAADGSDVWLDERADGAVTAFLGQLDAILKAHGRATTPEGRTKNLRKAGFTPVRKRGMHGSDYKQPCIPGARVRGV